MEGSIILSWCDQAAERHPNFNRNYRLEGYIISGGLLWKEQLNSTLFYSILLHSSCLWSRYLHKPIVLQLRKQNQVSSRLIIFSYCPNNQLNWILQNLYFLLHTPDACLIWIFSRSRWHTTQSTVPISLINTIEKSWYTTRMDKKYSNISLF